MYFHSTSKNEKNILYFKAEKELKEIIFQNNEKFKNKVINFDQYEKTRLFLSRKFIQIRRDKGTALIKDNIQSKLLNELKNRNILFVFTISLLLIFLQTYIFKVALLIFSKQSLTSFSCP